jgi:hypothetical protein
MLRWLQHSLRCPLASAPNGAEQEVRAYQSATLHGSNSILRSLITALRRAQCGIAGSNQPVQLADSRDVCNHRRAEYVGPDDAKQAELGNRMVGLSAQMRM